MNFVKSERILRRTARLRHEPRDDPELSLRGGGRPEEKNFEAHVCYLKSKNKILSELLILPLSNCSRYLELRGRGEAGDVTRGREDEGIIGEVLWERFDEPRVCEVEYLPVRQIDRLHLEAGRVGELWGCDVTSGEAGDVTSREAGAGFRTSGA